MGSGEGENHRATLRYLRAIRWFIFSSMTMVLSGVLGGLAVLASARERWVVAAGLAALVALTRNDGFLFAPCLALAFRGLPALVVAASGPIVAGLWHLRNAALVGSDYWEVRTIVANALHPDEFILATATVLSFVDRISIFTGEATVNTLFHWFITLPVPAVVAMFWYQQRWMVATRRGPPNTPVNAMESGVDKNRAYNRPVVANIPASPEPNRSAPSSRAVKYAKGPHTAPKSTVTT